jgi:cytochrome c553
MCNAEPRAFIALCVAALAGCDGSAPQEGEERGRVLYAMCVPCHGDSGEGNREYGAPAIAGLDAWYVETQLEHFAGGIRGAHPDDEAGLRMRPMVQTLRNPSDTRSVAAYVATLPPVDPAPTLAGGDPERGRALYATCAECHGADGAGDRQRAAPNLTRAQDWYLHRQLENFRNGIRGADSRDATGATMRPMAMTLPDDQAVRDVISYITTLEESAP